MAAWVGSLHLTGDALRKARMWLVVTGAVSLITGVLAIIVPIVATITTAIFVGWLLIVVGTMIGVHAWMQRATGGFGWRMLDALLTFAVGVLLVVLPLSGAVGLTLVLAAWFFADRGADGRRGVAVTRRAGQRPAHHQRRRLAAARHPHHDRTSPARRRGRSGHSSASTSSSGACAHSSPRGC
jgi:hypothetical protein